MPIYEYACASCGEHFERRQSFSDEPIRACPDCGGPTKKVLQPVGIVFKGSGWYITDSRKSASSDSSDSKADVKTEAMSETKSDAKSDAKSEVKPASGSDAKTETPKSTSTDSAKPVAASTTK